MQRCGRSNYNRVQRTRLWSAGLMRSVLRLIFFVAVLLLISPFFISSLLIDQRGVELSGRVFSKDEYIVVHSASWDRKCDVMVEYTAPDGSGVSFLTGQMQPDQFDHVQTGDPVPLHYLREKDLPDYPGTKTLRQMHLLPSVRLANRNTWSGLATLVSTHETALTAVLSVVLILFLWRVFRVPYFAWVLFACALLAIGISYVSEFPNPMPAPEHNVRTAKGTVKSLENWKWLFSGTRRKGVRADQPIEIASVQFVPEGRTQPVVAVDLIDAGSVPGL